MNLRARPRGAARCDAGVRHRCRPGRAALRPDRQRLFAGTSAGTDEHVGRNEHAVIELAKSFSGSKLSLFATCSG